MFKLNNAQKGIAMTIVGLTAVFASAISTSVLVNNYEFDGVTYTGVVEEVEAVKAEFSALQELHKQLPVALIGKGDRFTVGGAIENYRIELASMGVMAKEVSDKKFTGFNKRSGIVAGEYEYLALLAVSNEACSELTPGFDRFDTMKDAIKHVVASGPGAVTCVKVRNLNELNQITSLLPAIKTDTFAISVLKAEINVLKKSDKKSSKI